MTWVENSLRRADLRQTLARVSILSLFEDVAQSLDVEMAYARLAAQGSDVSLPTCYRVMRELGDKGILMREWTSNGKALYWRAFENSAESSMHRLVCRLCQQAFKLDDELTRQLDRVARVHGLNLDGEPMTIYGQCACKLRKGAKPPRHERAQTPAP